MEIKKIELINVPKPHNHVVEIAKVKQIAAKELQIGDLVLFGFHLLLIEDLEVVGHGEMFKLKSLNLATGESGSIGYPVNSVFHRVIECEITEMEQDEYRRWYTWKRMRRPILGEMTYCGACQGDCKPITQEEIDSFSPEDDGIVCGISNCYEPTRDIFLSYDGCEEPTTER